MPADRLVYIVYLTPAEPGADGVRGIRALLKTALRRHRLRCIRLTTYDPLELEASAEGRVADEQRAHE